MMLRTTSTAPETAVAPAARRRPNGSWVAGRERWRRLREAAPDLGAAAIIGFFVLGCAGIAVKEARVFDGVPYNGAFQLLNPLRRIVAGEIPGQDFWFFHGIGVPYLHLPIYCLAGGGIFASELSRQVMAPALFLVGVYAVLRAATPTRRLALRLLAVAIALGSLVRLDMIALVGDGSLLGARSFMPLVAVAVLAVALRRPGPQWVRFGVVGTLAGAAFLCGTEQGLAFGVALAVVLLAAGGPLRQRLIRLAFVGACAAALILVVLLAITRGRPAAAGALLRFALVDIPADQFWFFGAPPNTYVNSITDLFSLPIPGPFLLWGVVTAGLAIRGYRNGTLPRWAALCALGLSVYGLITFTAYLGISTVIYLVVGLRAFGLATVFLLVRRSGRTQPYRIVTMPRFPRVAVAAALIVVGLGLISMNLGSAALRLPGNTRALLTQGPQVSAEWRRYLAQADRLIGPHHCASPADHYLWSTYTGLLHAQRGCFNPGTDYTIHALGPGARERYAADFRAARPAYAETVRREVFRYEDWLRYNTWDFYRELFTNYEPVGLTEHSVFWRRAGAGQGLVLGPSNPGPPAIGGSVAITPPRACDLLAVDIRYRASEVLREVPLFGELNRHLIAVRGSRGDLLLSLNPAVQHASFSVLIRPSHRSIVLTPLVTSLVPGGRMALTGVSWRCGTFPRTKLWRAAVNGGDRPLVKLPDPPGPRRGVVVPEE
jgi:hypothetical protein